MVAGHPETLPPALAATAPYVLLIEDHPGDARLTQALLDDAPGLPPLRWVQTLEAALHMLDAAPACSAVLLDLGLPDGHGLQALQAITRHADALPVVVLTGDDDEAMAQQAVAAGAQDILVKGRFDAALLRRCIRFSVQRKRAEQALRHRSLHDELTQLPRRALFMDRLQTAMQACARNSTLLALLYIDVDHFKQINDCCGHAAGDGVLRAVAQRLGAAVRASDTVARLGGDEFVVLLPGMGNPLQALTLAHQLLETVLEAGRSSCAGARVGLSIGVAQWRGADESAAQLIARADAAMYQAKQAGRGQVTML